MDLVVGQLVEGQLLVDLGPAQQACSQTLAVRILGLAFILRCTPRRSTAPLALALHQGLNVVGLPVDLVVVLARTAAQALQDVLALEGTAEDVAAALQDEPCPL